MRPVRRIVVAASATAAWWMVSCREIPAPEGGIASISAVLLPSPGLVAGDTMRDSLGLTAPLRLVAYTIDGDPANPQPVPTFVVLDTGAQLVGDILLGTTAGTTVRIVGGAASLQTGPAPVKVTLSPDTLMSADSTVHLRTYVFHPGTDTVVASADLATLVQHLAATNTGVEAVIVRYVIERKPTGNGSGPTALLMSGNFISGRDTTDASGRAARTARLRLLALTSVAPETVDVSATASYRGRTIGTVQFSVIFKPTAQ